MVGQYLRGFASLAGGGGGEDIWLIMTIIHVILAKFLRYFGLLLALLSEGNSHYRIFLQKFSLLTLSTFFWCTSKENPERLHVRSSLQVLFLVMVSLCRRKIILRECNAKCRYLKKLTCKGTLRQVFYLSEAPYASLTPYSPLHTVYLYTVYLFTQGRGGGELTRGAFVHDPVENTNMP
jgi:hypothetical protein